MFHLSVLPLTRQLSNIAGNLWAKTLQHTRAQRVEYLLLHEFHARKFMLPDKLSAKERTFGRGNTGGDDFAGADGGDPEEGGGVKAGKKKGGPAYAGGLVLEPKKGLYDKYVLMLDFNSLYPSIIQEYDICFTTVAQPRGRIPMIPPRLPRATLPTDADGTKVVLPQVIKKLVDRRREVKNMIKTERNAARGQAARHSPDGTQAHRKLHVRLPGFRRPRVLRQASGGAGHPAGAQRSFSPPWTSRRVTWAGTSSTATPTRS